MDGWMECQCQLQWQCGARDLENSWMGSNKLLAAADRRVAQARARAVANHPAAGSSAAAAAAAGRRTQLAVPHNCSHNDNAAWSVDHGLRAPQATVQSAQVLVTGGYPSPPINTHSCSSDCALSLRAAVVCLLPLSLEH